MAAGKGALNDALERLDRLLLRVCDLEQARAERLRGDNDAGWDAVRNLARPGVSELAYSPALPETPLLGERAPPMFARVRTLFGLRQVEEEILLLLLAAHLEPRYTRLYAVLQDDTAQGWALERLLVTVLGRTPNRRKEVRATLADGGRLVGAGLVYASTGTFAPLCRPFDLASEVRDALLELPVPVSCGALPLEWITSAQRVDGRDEAADGSARGRGRFDVVWGRGERAMVAAQVASECGLSLLRVSWTGREERSTLRSIWRLAALRGAMPAFDLTACDDAQAISVAQELQWLSRTWGPSALVLSEVALPLPAVHHEAPAPTFRERRATWQQAALSRGLTLGDAGAARLAANVRADQRTIDAAFDTASAPTVEALSEAALRLARMPLRHGYLVRAVRTLEDLVVGDVTRAGIERLVYQARHRDAVAERRGLLTRFGLGAGPIALFSGRSGTGKTLAAEAVAAEVGRPLYVVDLSRLVSKYVGETEKNIDEVLTGGERIGAVLFFDESDALFSARTDVGSSNDRYANLEVGFLLQRIERHDGLVILATNLQSTIDEAFLRRFHARIEFPYPTVEDRRRIWELMLPDGMPRSGDLDLARIADRHRLSGGDIRNAALKAIFLAESEDAPISAAHLDRAVALELQEQGRLSRRAESLSGGTNDAGVRLRRLTETLQASLDAQLRRQFLKEVHVVHGAPTKEALAGKRPAVSVALYRLAATPASGLRVGFIVSAWCQRAEEENELLGVLHSALAATVPSDVDGRRVSARLQESYDFDLLQRFWSSHGHPVRGSLVLDVALA